MSCLAVCGGMAALASPDLVPMAASKEEDCDKDSGHHSGEELECAAPVDQVMTLSPNIF